ncbi:MAG: TetR/AcrR family transcriptional regulator C-terminal ligand-binding domain-containing protein [Mycobacterium sp.]
MAGQRSVDDRLAATTLQLLRGRGPAATTVEAVAAASGIAKTTIYRRHRDRRDMLASALAGLDSPPLPVAHADGETRLRWVIANAVAVVQDGIGFGGLAALLTKGDPEFTALFQEILARQRAVLEAVINDGKADGSLRPDVDNATLIDAVVGAYIAENARRESVAHGWETRIFELLWPAVRPGVHGSGDRR